MSDFFSEIFYVIKSGSGFGRILILLSFIGMFLFPIIGIVTSILYFIGKAPIMSLITGIILIVIGILLLLFLIHQYKTT